MNWMTSSLQYNVSGDDSRFDLTTDKRTSTTCDSIDLACVFLQQDEAVDGDPRLQRDFSPVSTPFGA